MIEDPSFSLMQRGIDRLRTEDYLLAFLDFDRALKLCPDDVLLRGLRGQALSNLHSWNVESQRELLLPDYANHWIVETKSKQWQQVYAQEILDSFEQTFTIANVSPEILEVRTALRLYQGDCIHNDLESRTQAYLDALDYINQAIDIAPENSSLWKTRIKVLQKLQHDQDAFQSSQRLLEIAPEDYEVWNIYGYILLWNLKRPQEALSAYDRALQLIPENDVKPQLRAYRGRGIALEELGRYEEALASYERSIQFGGINDSNGRAKKLRPKVALINQERAIQENPRDWKAWYAKAQLMVSQEDYAAAIPCYDTILGIQPELSDITYERGVALARLGRQEEAIADFDRVIEQQPSNPEYWHQKGKIFLQRNQQEAAIAIYEHVLTLDPIHSLALFDRGEALFALSRFEEAIAAYDQFLDTHDLSKNDLSKNLQGKRLAWYKKGLTLINLGRYQEALLSHRRFARRNSNDPEDDRTNLESLQEASGWYSWGNFLVCNDFGNYREAAIILQQAINLEPNLYSALSLCAYAMLKLERYAESIAYYKRSLSLQDTEADDWHNLAIAQVQVKSYEAAKSSYDRALAIEPNDPKTLTNKGDALRLAGLFDEAITSYNQAIAFSPEYQAAFYGKSLVYASQGNIEQTLENLREGVSLIASCKSSSIHNYAISTSQESAFDFIRELPEFIALIQEAETAYYRIFGTPAGFYPNTPSGKSQ